MADLFDGVLIAVLECRVERWDGNEPCHTAASNCADISWKLQG